MADIPRIEDAFSRFESALRQFESALARNAEREQKSRTAQMEAETLRTERARLANEMELVRSKASDLVQTNNRAVNKIDAAMSRIRAVLHSNSGGG
jgi:FtsZ-binding cell division protein ZapB